jgi:peptidoglycan-associated lipoprotein
MRRHAPVLLALLAAFALVACGGPKRPPAAAGPPPPPPPDEELIGGSGGRSDPDAVDWGPDISPVDSDSSLGEVYLGDEYGEGGPLADVLFEYDRATLSPEARATLEQHARWLLSRPSAHVVIEGHCDERGTVEYNLALGDQRARAAMEYLLSLGVPAGRMTVVSLGKERPLDPGSNEAAWARNRRAHFVVRR